jgi:hypothetical protein
MMPGMHGKFWNLKPRVATSRRRLHKRVGTPPPLWVEWMGLLSISVNWVFNPITIVDLLWINRLLKTQIKEIRQCG